MKQTLLQIIRFIIVGAVVVVFNLSLLYFFTDILNVWYLVSSMLAWFLSVILNFTLQRMWVFGTIIKTFQKRQLILYLLTAAAYLASNTGLMYLSVDRFHIQYLLSQALITLVLSCLTFLINKKVIFRDE